MLTISHQAGVTLAEAGFLLILIAGVWMVASELLQPRWHRFRMVVAGGALTAAGILLIVATHAGGFG